MTYDKVQFALNKHHFVQHRDSENNEPVNPVVEVEKVSISILPAKQKRKQSAYEFTLPNINEVADYRRCSGNAFYNNELKDRKFGFVEEKESIENEHSSRCGIIKLDKLGKRANNRKEKVILKYSNEKHSTVEEMSASAKSRQFNGNGSGVDDSDIYSKSGTVRSDSSEVCEGEADKAALVPGLDIGEDYVYKRRAKLKTVSNKASNKGTGVGSPLSEHLADSTKLRSVKCEHMLAKQTSSHDFSSIKGHNSNKIMKIDPDKCMMCEVTEATAKYASVEANRLLLEIVYPHDFYDKFQRSGKRTKANTNQKNLETSKEQMNMCKSVPVASKPLRREKTTILPSQSSASDFPVNTIRETYRSRLREGSEHDLSPQKKIKRDGENETRKEIHLQCKAKNNAMVVTDDSEGQKLVLKGLKGWILKKDDTCKNKIHKEIKKTPYQVNSLGMRFSIPEYNASLSDRKLQSVRLLTYIASPYPHDSQQQIRKSVTQNISPRNHVTNQTPPRNIKTVPTRTFNGLHRGYTHAPKLVSDSSIEESLEGFKLSKENKNNDHKSVETGSSFQKGSAKLSLPPIKNGMKSRSLTLTQF